MPGDELVRAVQAVSRGEAVLAPEVVSHVMDWARESKARYQEGLILTAQEMLALSFVAAGHTNRDIAKKLSVSEGTVKAYLRSAMRKLGVEERSQAVAVGIRRGVI
jgi:DNA-binding NarL/FixJ family response regulator